MVINKLTRDMQWVERRLALNDGENAWGGGVKICLRPGREVCTGHCQLPRAPRLY